MIGYDRLGTNGRFGNQLFQYAALRGIAAHHGYEWCIPPDDHHTYANYGIHHPFKLKHLKHEGFVNANNSPQAMFSYENIQQLNSIPNVRESGHNFDQELFDNFEDGSNLDGFCQTEKYFKHIENEIREDFEFKDDILQPCKEFIDQYEKIIFLHVRRGDNVGREDYHPIVSFDYYDRARKYFDDDVNILVCTDDPEWCAEQPYFDDDKFLLNTDVPKYDHLCLEGDGTHKHSCVPYTDLCLMSLCQGAILAPSTLGWWGAWLQNGKGPVVAPKKWFGSKMSHLDLSDLFPDDWIALDD